MLYHFNRYLVTVTRITNFVNIILIDNAAYLETIITLYAVSVDSERYPAIFIKWYVKVVGFRPVPSKLRGYCTCPRTHLEAWSESRMQIYVCLAYSHSDRRKSTYTSQVRLPRRPPLSGRQSETPRSKLRGILGFFKHA